MFDFFKKKDAEKSEEDVTIAADAVQVKEKDEKPAPMETFQRSCSDFSSVSSHYLPIAMINYCYKQHRCFAVDSFYSQSRIPENLRSSEEENENGEKTKKEGLKDKIKECSSEREETENKDSSIPEEKCDEKANAEATHPDDKKGFLEKIKEKLPGQHKSSKEGIAPACYAHEPCAKL